MGTVPDCADCSTRRKSESLSNPFIPRPSISIFRPTDKTAVPAPLRLGPAPGLVAQVYAARRPLQSEDRTLLLWLHGGRATGLTVATLEPAQLLNPIRDFLREAARRALPPSSA